MTQPAVAPSPESIVIPRQVASQPTSHSILIYGMNYAPEMAGVGRYTGEIAEHLAALGSQVTVVTCPPHYPGWAVPKGFRNRYGRGTEGGVRVYRTPLVLRRRMGGVWRLIAPLTFALSSAPVVFWQILRRRPDTVMCVEPTLFASPVALLAASLVGAQTVLHVQDLEVDAAFAVGHLGKAKWLAGLAYGFERLVLRNFDRIITISERMRQKLAEKGIAAEKLAVLRNWVDLEHIFPLEGDTSYRDELGYAAGDFIVLYSGNIGAKQGLNVLLDAAERLSVSRPHIKFVIAGEGPVKDDLVSQYGHLPNLRFLPFQPYARLNEFLNMADLHALPQDRGAADLVLPSKLGGMLASGKQIVVTAEPETELANFLGGSTILIAPGDAEELATAIERAARGVVQDRAELRLSLSRRLSKSIGIAEFAALVGAVPARE
ncbi:WcaI family glycosyltransferase [Rhizobium sp. BK251]|uniref:WcaI family glycosyltransferase n=1 Tax=Rhizobium sp. BK251 TaxID=2512125 RepID=UPI0010EB3B85|nr:WcaI family glycosyltransferase [Rhizobium sp. BK251]TCL72985.1 colanic acid biosynthesis glycosyl transferase WcaI [Rhizobium sp. BK251]